MSKNISVYISLILRHKPEEIGIEMDEHGWVSTKDLIQGINRSGKYRINMVELEEIVAQDEKGRYRFNENKTKIKACQGHSISWVTPELTYCQPPSLLYHGTTAAALALIKESGGLSKMKRHAVHMHSDKDIAWSSATRKHNEKPVMLVIDAEQMYNDGIALGCSDNGVWCAESVPMKYVINYLWSNE